MATRDRRGFVPQAIQCFLAQTKPGPGWELELVVVDDGKDAVADLIPADPRIRYRRHDHALSLRDKRQMSLDEARGEVFLLWDDDDWHGPERVARQVRALLQGHGACLLDPILFHDLAANRTWRWCARGRFQMCVGTLAFTQRYYDLIPGGFPPPVPTSSDQQFVRERPWSEVVYVPGADSYVAVRHGGNSTGCVITPGGPWSEEPSVRSRLLI